MVSHRAPIVHKARTQTQPIRPLVSCVLSAPTRTHRDRVSVLLAQTVLSPTNLAHPLATYALSCPSVANFYKGKTTCPIVHHVSQGRSLVTLARLQHAN